MLFGVTMGDAGGVGPEILLKSFGRRELHHPVVVFGDLGVLERCNRELHYGVPLRRVSRPGDYIDGPLNVLDLGLLRAEDVRVGQIDARSGAAAREYVVAATRAALEGEIAALVTLPINKEATQASDPSFSGHTELIGALCGVKEPVMMLACEQLIVTHVTTHIPLREAAARIKRERVARVLELTWHALGRLRPQPRIGVAGLNPHAGEHGLFGREELEEIAPAVEWARGRGWSFEGPLSPDTVFYQAVCKRRFDAVVAMYHDQGHIPVKLLDFEGGVNVTLGLPVVRTSVDHGTAFDIAWRGVASTRSFVRALELAARLVAAPAASEPEL